MKNPVVSRLAVVFLLGAACGPDPVLGSYGGTYTQTITTSAPAARSQTTTGSQDLAVTAGASADYLVALTGAMACTLAGHRAAAGLALAAGQSCTYDDGAGDHLVLTVATGTGTLAGDTLTLAVAWTLAGTAGGAALAGTVSTTITGRRR